MTVFRGRLEGEHIVEFDYPSNILNLPGITWVDIPDYFMQAGNLLALKLVNGEVVPVDEAGYKNQIKSKVSEKRRLARENGSVVMMENEFQTDIESIGALTSAVGLAQIYEQQNGEGSFSTDWKSKTGFVTLKYSDLLQLAFLTGKFTSDIFAKENEYFGQIDAETDYGKCIEIAATAFDYLTAIPDDLAAGEGDNQSVQTNKTAKVSRTTKTTTKK